MVDIIYVFFSFLFFLNEYLGKCRLFTANATLVTLHFCQQENCSTWPRTVLSWVPSDNINQVRYTFDTMAAAVSINISVGMRPHAHTPWLWESHSQRQEDKGTTFQETLLCANAGICHCLVWCDVPTSLLRVYCSEPLAYTMLGKRSGRPLSSAPFTKQPLWSEARIRMIMWTVFTNRVSCSCSARYRPAASVWASLCFTCEQVHIRWSSMCVCLFTASKTSVVPQNIIF